MHQLASMIRTNLDTLAEEYARRVQEIGGYAELSAQDRLDVSRYDLELMASCLDAEDDGVFVRFIHSRTGQRLDQAFAVESLQQALTALEETLQPLTTTVETAQFLWRALSRARNIVYRQAGEMLRKTEEALRESEQRYRRIVEEAIDIIYTSDPRGNFTYVSPASERLMGYPESELIGTHFTKLIHPEWKEQVQSFYLDQFRKRMPETVLQFPIITRSGEEKWVEQTVALVADGDRVAGFQSVVRDITERKRLEQQIQESELKFREMINRALVGIFRTTLAGQIVEANPAVIDLLRFDSIEHANQVGLLNMYVDAADRQRLLEMVRQGPVTGFETRFRRGDGEIITISVGATLIRDEQGAPLFIEGTLEDVTERSRLERLRDLESLYGATSREGWQASRGGKGAPGGYLFDRATIRLPDDFWVPEMGLAVERGMLALSAGGDQVPALRAGKAAAVAPLSVRGEVMGVLGVQHDPDNPLSADDLALVELVSEQVAQALENARLFAETQSRARELAVLNEMGRTLTGMLNLDAVIDSIRYFASQLVDTTNFFVGLYDAEQDAISFPLFIDGEVRINEATRRSGKGMSEYVIRSRQPLLVKENLSAVQAELGITSIGQPGQSWLGVPMMIGEQPIGLITVQSYTTPRVYDEHDRDLLVAVASQAAIAIQNARLFGEQQRTAGLLGERLKQLDCLSDIGRRTQEAPPLPEFLEWVAERIPAAMRYPDVCLAAVEFEGHLYGAPDARVGDHLSLDTEAGGGASMEGEPHPSRLPGSADELSVPRQMVQGLRIGNETVGHVYVTYPEEQEFADEESALLGDIVRRVSGYVENRRLLEETEQASQRLAEERALLRTLIDALPDPTFVKDRNSRFTISNVAHAQILGAASEEEIVGQTDFDRFPQEMAAGFYADEQEIMRSGQPLINREEYVVDEKGERRWLWTTKVPLRDDQGRVTGLVGINHDITDRKLSEEVLRRRGAQLECLSDIGQRIGEAAPAPEFLQWVAERIPAAFQYPELCLAAIEFEGATYGAAEALQQPRQMVQSLRREREIVGRLCVAYREERDFLDEESALLGDMARRVSGYIENRRLFEQTQAALAEVEATHRRYLQTQWQGYLQQKTGLQRAGYMYQRGESRPQGVPEREWSGRSVGRVDDRAGATEVSPVLEGGRRCGQCSNLWRPEIEQALNAAAPAWVEVGDIPPEQDDGRPQRAGLAVPIVLRGQTIGVLGIEDPDASQGPGQAGRERWSDEEVALLEEVGQQLALALENARLFEETQRRAERERLITNITARIRSSTDMLGVLETTATELGKALGTSRVLVRLTSSPESQASPQAESGPQDGVEATEETAEPTPYAYPPHDGAQALGTGDGGGEELPTTSE